MAIAYKPQILYMVNKTFDHHQLNNSQSIQSINIIFLIFISNLKVSLSIFCPMDCSPPGSSVFGILQARLLEWFAISFYMGIFPTQGLNSGFLHCRQVFYYLIHQGSPMEHQITKTIICALHVTCCCCCCLVVQSCPTVLQPHQLYSPPGSSVHGISQARIPE